MNSLIEVRLQNGKVIRYANLKYSMKVKEITIVIELNEKEEEYLLHFYSYFS